MANKKELECPECGGVASDQPTAVLNYRKLICLDYFTQTRTAKQRKTPCKKEFPYKINA